MFGTGVQPVRMLLAVLRGVEVCDWVLPVQGNWRALVPGNVPGAIRVWRQAKACMRGSGTVLGRRDREPACTSVNLSSGMRGYGTRAIGIEMPTRWRRALAPEADTSKAVALRDGRELLRLDARKEVLAQHCIPAECLTWACRMYEIT